MKFLISIKRYTFVTRAAFSRASVREHASTEQLKMTAALMFSMRALVSTHYAELPSALRLSKIVVNSLNYPIYLETLVLQTTLIIF